MAYKPQNVAKFRDDAMDYPGGTGNGRGPGTVPGTSKSNDRDSQQAKAEFYNDGNAATGSGDYSFFMNNGDNQDTKSRGKEGFGKATYNYNQPTL